MKAIYLAAPLFNERELQFNRLLRSILSRRFNVFLPQEDGLLLAELVGQGVNNSEAQKIVFNADASAMNEADILFAVLDGATVDEGVAFEVGYMFAQGKHCVAFQSDVRRQLPTGNNPMIQCAMSLIFSNLEEVEKWVEYYGLGVAESEML